jgi:hypothetical protein
MAFNRSEIEPFRVDVVPDREEVRVSPVGELDLATVPLVEDHAANAPRLSRGASSLWRPGS